MSRIETLEMRLQDCRDDWQVAAKNAARRISEWKEPNETDVQWLASLAGSLVWHVSSYSAAKARLAEALHYEERE
jgi:hypothetical protein